MRNWLKGQGLRLGREDSDELQLFQYNGADAQFTYVSTSEMKDGNGKAAAGGIAVGVSRDILFKEERSQYAPGAGDPLNRRLDAGRLPSRPTRELGTPGAGQGIEAEIEKADYHFYPHYKCPECSIEAPLNPKGCLLKPSQRVTNGKEVEVYLSEAGRPIAKNLPDGTMEAYWHHHDRRDPIKSAYFGCSRCGCELSLEVRSSAWYQCLKTGARLRGYLDSLPQGIPDAVTTAGITISPCLRESKTNVASEIIDEGLNCANTADWQQQRLGQKSESSVTAVTLDMLKASMAAPSMKRSPSVTLCGIDQGRSSYYLWIADFYLPRNYELYSLEQVFEQTIQVTRFAQDILITEIPNKLRSFDVDFGLIDNEPERREASELSRITCLELADQKPGQMSDFREIKVESGGIEYPCWGIANEKFLKLTLNSFALTAIDGYPLNRVPKDWERWIGVKSEMSPIRQLTGPKYDPNSGRWTRGDGNIDDLFYACMFTQAAFYLYLSRVKPKVKTAPMTGGKHKDPFGGRS